MNLECAHDTYQGWTALHFAACSSDDLELIQFLLLNGADPAAKTADGDTPYSLAAATGKPVTVMDKLKGGDLLQTELKQLGVYRRIRSILQANEIDTIDDLEELGLFELMALHDKGNAMQMTRDEALAIWMNRYPTEIQWGYATIKLLLACCLLWVFLHVAEFIVGTPIFH